MGIMSAKPYSNFTDLLLHIELANGINSVRLGSWEGIFANFGAFLG
jgi:hypothetical protein